MFVSSSGQLNKYVYLLTLGHSCRYAIGTPDSYVITDPGLSAHIPHLLSRLDTLELPLENLNGILITHPDADRLGGLAYFHSKLVSKPPIYMSKEALKSIKNSSGAIQSSDQQISAYYDTSESSGDLSSITKYIQPLLAEDNINTKSSPVEIHFFKTACHHAGSLGYFIEEIRTLIADESLGYFRGKSLVAPGADFSISGTSELIDKVKRLPISSLCLPYMGAISGSLCERQVTQLAQNTSDLISEYERAISEEIPEQSVESEIKEGFYSTDSKDPCFREALDRSFEAILKQLRARAVQSS